MEDASDTERRIDRLESLVEAQQEHIERQQERIDDLETRLEDRERATGVTRRGALTGLGTVGLLGLLTGSATADPQGTVGTSSDPASTVYTDTLTFHDNSGDGSSFSITENATYQHLTISYGGTDTHVFKSDSETYESSTALAMTGELDETKSSLNAT